MKISKEKPRASGDERVRATFEHTNCSVVLSEVSCLP